MNFKILMTGSNNSVTADLLRCRDKELDFITTTADYDDLKNHIKYLQPSLFLYCMGNDSKSVTDIIAGIRQDILTPHHIPVAVICEPPQKGFLNPDAFPGGSPQLLLFRSLNANDILYRIKQFLKHPSQEQLHAQGYFPNKSTEKPVIAIHETAANTEPTVMGSIFEENNNLSKEEIVSLNDIISEENAVPAQKKTILVIDDSPNMIKVIKVILEEHYHVICAISGKVAVRYLLQKQPDLILLDYEMPNEDGPQVLKNIRGIPECREIPVAFLTGINDAGKIQRALSLKPQGYILKPIEQSKLLSLVSSLIG